MYCKTIIFWLSTLPFGKISKHEFLISILSKQNNGASFQFLYSSLGKVFENKTKQIKRKKTVVEQGRKHIDAIINKNKRLAALANKLDHKGYKSIFQELVIETFYEMK